MIFNRVSNSLVNFLLIAGLLVVAVRSVPTGSKGSAATASNQPKAAASQNQPQKVAPNQVNGQQQQQQQFPPAAPEWPSSEEAAQAQSGLQGAQPITPTIKWGRCPQLEPTQSEKLKKAEVITKCLEIVPIPNNITRETVELHREQIAACALQMEGWFTDDGNYRFEKAESEIKNKKLDSKIEEQVLGYHGQCKEEAVNRFPTQSRQVIAQIQLYQACMDYFISEVCGIEVTIPEGAYAQFQ